jgi:hypothetical protein
VVVVAVMVEEDTEVVVVVVGDHEEDEEVGVDMEGVEMARKYSLFCCSYLSWCRSGLLTGQQRYLKSYLSVKLLYELLHIQIKSSTSNMMRNANLTYSEGQITTIL